MNRMNRTSLAALLVALLASCIQPNNASAQPAGDGFEFDGTEWLLESLNGEPLLEDTNITLEFAADNLNGYSGCNWYGGPYEATAIKFDVEYIAANEQACETPVGVMQQERAFYKAFGQTATYSVTNDRLELTNGAESVTLMFTQKVQLPMNPADLVGTKWWLRSVNGETLPTGSRVTLDFPVAGRVNGLRGCESYSGTYNADGDDIRITGQEVDHTGCAEGETAQGLEVEFSDLI